MSVGSTLPNLSVALCCHNGAKYIEPQIRSILNQVPAPGELVLSDDASVDDTVSIVKRVAAECGAGSGGGTIFTVLRNETPVGVTANFEQAVRACSGEIIVLSDQDDVWHEGRLARLVAALAERPGVLAVASDATLVDGEDAPLQHTLFSAIVVTREDLAAINGEGAFARLMKRNVFTGATMAFSREVLDVALPFPESWLHDEWLATIAAAMGPVSLLDETLIDYRQHGANQIGASRISFRGKISRLLEPRALRNQRMLARAEALASRIAEREETLLPGVATIAKGKLAHERMRHGLAVGRASRVVPVLREALKGGYRDFGGGMPDVLRDVVQRVA